MVVSGTWMKNGLVSHVANVYAPCVARERKDLWKKIIRIKQEVGAGAWCVTGDFNVVKNARERRGSGRNVFVGDSIYFERFIEDMNLMDLPLVGRKFTWYSSNDTAMSRLDRFLVSDEWLLAWPNLVQRGLKRSISDHCPILLKNEDEDWGPKPFRVFDCWFDHKDFRTFVKEQWEEMNIEGWAG